MLYYFTDLKNITKEQLDSLMPLLPPERLKRALKYKFPEDRLACVIAYLLFLYGYRTEYNLTDTPDFDISPDGKPYLKSHPEIYFNISHCSKAVMCILIRPLSASMWKPSAEFLLQCLPKSVLPMN